MDLSEPIFVQPARDLVIPDPYNDDFFPQEGRMVHPQSAEFFYVLRRIAEGSLVAIDMSQESPPASPATSHRVKRRNRS